jgi:peptide/nickel transport system substrate-binding protein
VKYAWFNNPNFRRAVALSVNREKMIRLAYLDQATPNWGPSTRGNKRWFDPNVKDYHYDAERARRLLAREGFTDRNRDGWLEDRAGNRVQFTLATNADNTLRQTLCGLLKTDLKQVGIEVTVAPVDFNSLIGRIRETRDYDAILLGLTTGVPPDPALGQNVWKSKGKTHFWNVDQARPSTAWEAEIDSLMDEMARVEDYPKRKRMWDRIQEIVTDQAVFIFLPSEKAYLVARDRIGNLRPTVIPHRVLWNAPQLYLK